jgi:hypothetical protein
MRTLLFFLGWVGGAGVGVAFAVTTPMSTGGGTDSTRGLKHAVTQISEKSKKLAPDYAQMAQETIQFGSSPDAVEKLTLPEEGNQDRQEPWRNMVGDALAGVDEGEKIDAKAADWPKLREDLRNLQPPPPPKDKSSSKDKKKEQKEKNKKSGKDKGEPEKKKGKKEKSEEQKKGDENEEGQGEQDQGDSQSPPTPGENGKGGDSKEGESGKNPGKGEGEGQGGEQKQDQGKGKDPNQIKDYSSGKEQEGKMKDRAKEDEMKGIQDDKAGFGGMGQEKEKDKKGDQKKGATAQGEGKEKKEEAPAGMRAVGGGSGKRETGTMGDAVMQETLSRLEQVRQSDNPAALQQRLQPKDQRPSPSSNAKPW